MKLEKISTISGTIELLTGLHIGSGDLEMHIGGTDNPVIKNPITGEPYIPGSSLKGKIRSNLEWQMGLVSLSKGQPLRLKDIAKIEAEDERRKQAMDLLRLFGFAPGGANDDEELVRQIGPSRLAFWDCPLDPHWVEQLRADNLPLTEVKMENSIDRIKGVAQSPRNTERVPAGSRFVFRLTYKRLEGEDLMPLILQGLKLLELTGLGGSLSRGYGKLQFKNLKLDETDIQSEFDQVTH